MAASEAGAAAGTARRVTTVGRAVTAATTAYAEVSTCWTLRIRLRGTAVIVKIIPVTAPFPYVPAHVVQSKLVRLLLGNRMCLAVV